MKVSGTEIETINDDFHSEYVKLESLVFSGENDIREVDIDRVKTQVDKCIIEIKRFKSLKPIKLK